MLLNYKFVLVFNMRKQLLAIAILALLATNCGTPDTVSDKTITEPEAQAEGADSTINTEIDNTAVEIEAATAEVDSLMSEI
jgi:outer membrane lipoprotein SlyB